MRANSFFARVLPGFIFLFSACSKSSQQANTPPAPSTPVSVYTAGEGSGNNVLTAKYWKDSTQVFLSDSTHTENINGIYVTGNDVYLAGTEYSPTGSPTALYWKNGVKTLMNIQSSSATGITVSGGDVYVSGTTIDYSNAHVQSMYWKNGVVVPLTGDSSTRVSTSAIAVSGNDVYVAGYETNPAHTDREIARYWKNGVAVNISDTAKTAETTAIFISGNDVYVAGYESDQNSNYVAKYWKNGVPVTLSTGSAVTSLTGIWVSGTDVYASGTVYAPGSTSSSAVYWKNGNMVSMKGPNATFSSASGIAVFENDVYVAGNEDGYPKYWKNGTVVNLTPGSQYDRATGIFVAPK